MARDNGHLVIENMLEEYERDFHILRIVSPLKDQIDSILQTSTQDEEDENEMKFHSPKISPKKEIVEREEEESSNENVQEMLENEITTIKSGFHMRFHSQQTKIEELEEKVEGLLIQNEKLHGWLEQCLSLNTSSCEENLNKSDEEKKSGGEKDGDEETTAIQPSSSLESLQLEVQSLRKSLNSLSQICHQEMHLFVSEMADFRGDVSSLLNQSTFARMRSVTSTIENRNESGGGLNDNNNDMKRSSLNHSFSQDEFIM